MSLKRHARSLQPSRVEPLEGRALLTSMPVAVGPSLYFRTAHFLSAQGTNAQATSFAVDYNAQPTLDYNVQPAQGATIGQFASNAWPTSYGPMPARTVARWASPTDTLSFRDSTIASGAGPIGRTNIIFAAMAEPWLMENGPGGYHNNIGGPEPFSESGKSAFMLTGGPGRGPMPFDLIARFRDDMSVGLVRFGSRPLFRIVAPESYWENGLLGLATDNSLLASLGIHPGHQGNGSGENESAGNSGASSSMTQGNSSGGAQALLASRILINSVTIWTSPQEWAGSSLASLLLSRSELELGAFFSEDEEPDLSALLAALLDKWLANPEELILPLISPSQEVTTLEPVDETSLAFTASLVTVAGASKPGTSGPGPAPMDAIDPETSRAESKRNATPPPPAWAGFVIGLDEAFEANREAVRHWDSEGAPRATSSTLPGLAAPPDPNLEDQPIPRKPNPKLQPFDPAVEERIRRVLQESQEQETTPDPSWTEALSTASAGLVLIPTLWGELSPVSPARRPIIQRPYPGGPASKKSKTATKNQRPASRTHPLE